jgi:beta-glucosidase
MVEGFQTSDLAGPGAIAACVKHFAGYGASESGRDYNTTNIPPNELRNVYLEPFRMAVEAGVATLMTSFSDLDGIPATANAALLDGVLRRDWGFDGLVVSDWNAVNELIVHGLCEGPRDAALEAATAGVDMEMAGDAYARQLPALIREGRITPARIDAMVERVLRLKEALGLFDAPMTDAGAYPPLLSTPAREVAQRLARESLVLLKNAADTLPLDASRLTSIALIGPLADAPHEQMGTWVFDGQAGDTITPLAALRARFGDRIAVRHAPALRTSRARDTDLFAVALDAVAESDIAILILGEESILSGEAHSRADIRLPGAQSELLARVKALGKPIITVIMAGRPLVMTHDLPNTDALLYAWHPGTMGGPALIETLFGDHAPSGKLPVTLPRAVGQVPIYYNHKNTGRPPDPADMVLIDDIPVAARQTSLGMSAFHLDEGHEPLFPFGFGLSYGRFTLSDLSLSTTRLRPDETLSVRVQIASTGPARGTETVQLYIRDIAASLTRPVRELKAFQRVTLSPGESTVLNFTLTARDLAFHGRDGAFRAEPGEFQLWVGTSSQGGLTASFRLDP